MNLISNDHCDTCLFRWATKWLPAELQTQNWVALGAGKAVSLMNESELSRQLSDLREVAKRLNDESDAITTLIAQFQGTLRELNLGLEVWIPLQSEESAIVPPFGSKQAISVTTETALGYARGEDGWALYVKRTAYRSTAAAAPLGLVQKGEVVKANKWLKLLDASRSIRIAALDAFPKLLEALKASAESAVQSINNAKKFLD